MPHITVKIKDVGTITYDTTRYRFRATCPCGHKNCGLGRGLVLKRDRKKGVPNSRAAGRPLGLLMAWLLDAHKHKHLTAHEHNLTWKTLSWPQRRAGRDRFNRDAPAAAKEQFKDLERTDSEDNSEPEGLCQG